jgi:hypothetical protein
MAHHDPARSFRQAPKIVNEAFEGVPRAVVGKPLPLQTTQSPTVMLARHEPLAGYSVAKPTFLDGRLVAFAGSVARIMEEKEVQTSTIRPPHRQSR